MTVARATRTWLLGTALTVLLPAAPGLAAFPGENGRIAYACSKQICATNAAGTVRKRLSSGRGYRESPAYSANGRKIAFVRRINGRYDLYSMRSDGGRVVRLTHSRRGVVNFSPQFTPDGSRLVFERAGSGIHILELASGELTRLGPGYSPALSPDGGKIAFLRGRDTPLGYPRMWVMGVDGSGATPISSAESDVSPDDPNWSPDGERIVFEHFELHPPSGDSEQGIFTVEPDGSDLTRVSPADMAWSSEPAFSPDGERIAFLVDDRCDPADGCEPSLAVMDGDGDNARSLYPVAPGAQPDWGPKR